MGATFYLILAGDVLAAVILVLCIAMRRRRTDEREDDRLVLRQELERQEKDNTRAIQENIAGLGTLLSENQKQAGEMQAERLETVSRSINEQQRTMAEAVNRQLGQMENRMSTLERSNEEKLEAMRRTMEASLQRMQEDNSRKLDEMRKTVDEELQDSLQKKISESFQNVSLQLEEVYKGLGEMQSLAGDVGGLKKILSGVKTRGILGEVQLGAILREILSPDQYDENVATIPGSTERVEYAVRLPGDGRPVYLPIDSKFPGDTYTHLLEAQETGEPEKIRDAQKKLEQAVLKSAKDIRDKYVEVPYTTNFGIMFLPFEGLYATVADSPLLERLQREYSVNVAGPSTMAALLNALQMGFRTLTIQKRSSEVWQVLGAVKTEFAKYTQVLENMQKHLDATGDDLNTLRGVRTRAINRKLSDLQDLSADEAERVLGLGGAEEKDSGEA